MAIRAPNNFSQGPYIPKEPTYSAVRPSDMSASILLTPLNHRADFKEASSPQPPHSPQREPSCFGSICNCIHQCVSWICKCIQCIFCCCSEEKQEILAKAQNLVDNYNNAINKPNKYTSLKQLANLYKEHPEIKECYNSVVANLNAQELKIPHGITNDQIKQNPDFLIRVADYTRAYYLKEDIVKRNKTAQGMEKILNLSIDDVSDQKHFQQICFNTHSAEMLKDDDPTQSLEKFKENISRKIQRTQS